MSDSPPSSRFLLLHLDALRVLPEDVTWTAIRAQGAGGQNVNKVSNAIHLRFDISASRLPDDVKQRLLAVRDQRITAQGVVVIKAQSSRSLESNRTEAPVSYTHLTLPTKRIV